MYKVTLKILEENIELLDGIRRENDSVYKVKCTNIK